MYFHGFPWHRLYVHLTTTSRVVLIAVCSQGRRVMASSAIQGSHPRVVTGSQLALVLPSVLPVMSLQTSCGLHRFEPVAGAVLPPSWAMSLTRQGISLIVFFHVKTT